MIYRALNLFKKKFDKRTESERFKDLALLYYGGKYTWGREVPEEVDCSGLMCGVLTLMGYPIRVDADTLMTKFFNKDAYENDLQLVFFVAKDSYDSPSGTRLAGRARHVGILIGKDITFHARSPRATFETLEAVRERYDTSDMLIKSVNWEAIKSEDGHYGLDIELQ